MPDAFASKILQQFIAFVAEIIPAAGMRAKVLKMLAKFNQACTINITILGHIRYRLTIDALIERPFTNLIFCSRSFRIWKLSAAIEAS